MGAIYQTMKLLSQALTAVKITSWQTASCETLSKAFVTRIPSFPVAAPPLPKTCSTQALVIVGDVRSWGRYGNDGRPKPPRRLSKILQLSANSMLESLVKRATRRVFASAQDRAAVKSCVLWLCLAFRAMCVSRASGEHCDDAGKSRRGTSECLVTAVGMMQQDARRHDAGCKWSLIWQRQG